MADIKRYNCCDHTSGAAMHESATGGFVKHSDHEAALAAKDAEIQAAVAAEREAIALMVESHCWIYPELPPTRFVRLVAKAIRARGAAHE